MDSAYVTIKDEQGMIDLVTGRRPIDPRDLPNGVTPYKVRLFAWGLLRASGIICAKPEAEAGDGS